MSSILDQLGGGAGAPDPLSGPSDPAGGPYGPDPAPGQISVPQQGGDGGGDSSALVTQAKDLLRQALDQEPDHEDKLLIEKMLTECQQYLASQQKMTDQATGAGPGAKLVRKASGGY